MSRSPFPPLTSETATQKVRMTEDIWNSHDPARVDMAYSSDSRWRNRSTFLLGREGTQAFLEHKWRRKFVAEVMMQTRVARINDLPMTEAKRKYHWPSGRRTDNRPGLSELGL